MAIIGTNLYNLPAVSAPMVTLGQRVKWFYMGAGQQWAPTATQASRITDIAGETPGSGTFLFSTADISTSASASTEDIYVHGQEAPITIGSVGSQTGTFGQVVVLSTDDALLSPGQIFKALYGVRYTITTNTTTGATEYNADGRWYAFTDVVITGKSRTYPARGAYTTDIDFTYLYDFVQGDYTPT